MNGAALALSRLYVGHSDPTFIPKDPTMPPGTTVLNGPVIVGGEIDGQLPPPLSSQALLNIIKPATVTATLVPIPTKMTPALTAGIKISALGDGAVPYPGPGIMANALAHVISSNVPIPPSAVGVNILSSEITTITTPTLAINANTIELGTYTSVGARNKTGSETQTGAKAETGAKAATGVRAEASPASQNATLNVASEITSPTIVRLEAKIKSKKPFDIPHPTKQGWRLRYVCLEGPAADVYIRGELRNSNIIELPEYWKELVDEDTISVNLTPIGFYQELYVEGIEWGSNIVVKNNMGGSINCYYTVYGERKDVARNIPEYEGTIEDYPGNNDEYVFNGSK